MSETSRVPISKGCLAGYMVKRLVKDEEREKRGRLAKLRLRRA
jgi:hypothetical protein